MSSGSDQIPRVNHRRRTSEVPDRVMSLPSCNQAKSRMTTPTMSEQAAAITPNVVLCSTSITGGAGNDPCTGIQPTPTAPAPMSAVPTSPGSTLRAKKAGNDSVAAGV